MASDATTDSLLNDGAAASRPIVTREDRHGIEVITVDNGALTAAFLPGVGGRLISLIAQGREFLWRNPDYLDDRLRLRLPRDHWPVQTGDMSNWANLGGGKTWPAPQGWSGHGEWAGPPDPVLDGGPWSVGIDDDSAAITVRLSSPADARSGLQIVRRFSFTQGSPDFTERVTFVARFDRIVRWAIWEVVQVDSGRETEDPAVGVLIEVDSETDPHNLLPLLPRLDFEFVGPRLVRVPVQDRVGKLGFENAAGRIAFHRGDGSSLTLRFAIAPDAEYPDGGSRAELWMQWPVDEPIGHLGGLQPDARLVELEVLGPMTTLAPGESTSLTIHWSVLTGTGR